MSSVFPTAFARIKQSSLTKTLGQTSKYSPLELCVIGFQNVINDSFQNPARSMVCCSSIHMSNWTIYKHT